LKKVNKYEKSHLKHRKAQCASRDSDDVIVNSSEDELKQLRNTESGNRVGNSEGRSEDGTSGSFRDNGNVGELAVVSRAHRIQADEVQGVGIHVVTSFQRNDRGMVVRVDKGEVIGTHVSQSSGVLVDERSLYNRVNSSGGGEVNNGSVRVRGSSSVVRPFSTVCGISYREEKNLDGMRESYVIRRNGIVRGVESLSRSCLALLNEDITRSTSHSLTFVIGNNGIVGPYLASSNGGSAADKIGSQSRSTADSQRSRRRRNGSSIINDKELVKFSEREVNSHLIVRKSSSRKSYTTVSGVEERKGKVKCVSRDRSSWSMRSSQIIKVTNHIVVSISLSSGDSESCPEVKMVVIESSSNQIVECYTAFSDNIMHEVSCPSQSTVNSKRVVGSQLNLRGCQSKPGVKKIISSTRNRNRPFLPKCGLARSS
jgi:hypothetical protein